MYVQPYESPLTSALSPLGAEPESSMLSAIGGDVPGALAAGDAIARFTPPALNQSLQSGMQMGMLGPLGPMLQQLMQMLQTMMGYMGGGSSYGSGLGCNGYGGYGGCGYGNEQYFNNATGSSAGDPHLSFNGNHWDSMSSQPNLLSSDSIPGGFQVSTQVTPPNANGVTYNQCATVALNGGQTTVSMNNQGQATIDNFGQQQALAPGQTLQLGNGSSVTCNQNGSLTVLAQNGFGGQISTTLTAQGQGVNVQTSAQNVDLGGALVQGNQGWTNPSPIGNPAPIDPWQPITGSGPILTGPFSGTPVMAPPTRMYPLSE